MSEEQLNSKAVDYLETVRVNNPGLFKFWPGAQRAQKPGSENVRPQEDSSVAKRAEQASSTKSGCIPCSLGHIGTCSGLLPEAVRFAQSDGIDSDVPIDRISSCLDELNALERKDLTPELIDTLPQWEKDLAMKTLAASRKLRHSLEELRTLDDLIHVSAEVTRIRKEIGREWFRHKLATLTPQERQHLAEEALQKMGNKVEPTKKSSQTLTLEEAQKLAAEEAEKEVERAWNKGDQHVIK